MTIPRFHTTGESDGRFYVVAYVSGKYVSPSGSPSGDAFYVLNFSPSREWSRFSFSTVSPADELYAYTRGDDDLDSAEYALLQAWRDEGVPTHAWKLFPAAAIEESTFAGDVAARSAYEAARRRVALVLFHARTQVWVAAQYPTQPMFRGNEADYPKPMVDTPEYEEVSSYIMPSES